MSYPFVQAKFYTKGGMVEPRAVVVHLAEGGGTVAWLTHPTNDNSAHFVIEYSGRIVQMVKDGDADHSLHWDTDHWTASTCGYFSATMAKALLGAGGTLNPNAYLFAIECEGFASAGPNVAQIASLKALISDLRARHPTLKGVLGHRDFQGYKACPGCHVFDKIPHGEFIPESSTEADVAYVPISGQFVTNGSVRSFAAIDPYAELDAVSGTLPVTGIREIDGTGTPHGVFVEIATGTTGRRLTALAWGSLFTPTVPAPPIPTDCTAAVAAATVPLQAKIDAAKGALA